ncbi:MAG: hypothetical protein ACTTJC_07310 [Campylobacter sp.]
MYKICERHKYSKKGSLKQKNRFNDKIYDKGVKNARIQSKTSRKGRKRKAKYDLKDYCEMRGLSLSGFYKGYISQKARKILKKNGIKVA